MIQIGRMTATAVVVVLAGTTLAACGPPSDATALPSCLVPNKPVALAIGARSNSPMPAMSATVSKVLTSAVNADKTITLVRLDGKPRVVFSQALAAGANSQITKQNKDTYVTGLNRALSGTAQRTTDIQAQAPQADVLDALAEAASVVPAGGDVIVMDSGLQTIQPLAFQSGLLSDDPALIVHYLKRAGELPPLKGRNVYFVGLGWTASPQPPLGIHGRHEIVQIWKQIAKAAGARCVGSDDTANTRSAVPNRPAVVIVPPPPPPPSLKPCTVISLGDANNVGFVFNSTAFRDPAGARATLGKLAHLMLQTNESVTLIGSTSSDGSNQYNDVLSLRRANAVKAVLIKLGVPASRITTIGDGSHMPGRLNDRGPKGQLLIGPAIQDRKVVAKLRGSACRTS
jgi:outer membrane protein OmpA-like peptidoglycan-associated protein